MPFTNCINKIKNKQVDIADDLDALMSIYNLRKHSNDHAKTSAIIWHYHKYNSHYDIEPLTPDLEPFKFKPRITVRAPTVLNKNDVQVTVQFKYLSKSSRTLEISLIISEINLRLIWSAICVITN